MIRSDSPFSAWFFPSFVSQSQEGSFPFFDPFMSREVIHQVKYLIITQIIHIIHHNTNNNTFPCKCVICIKKIGLDLSNFKQERYAAVCSAGILIPVGQILKYLLNFWAGLGLCSRFIRRASQGNVSPNCSWQAELLTHSRPVRVLLCSSSVSSCS